MDSEKEARHKVEKQRRQLNDELEHLRDSLEESESSTAAQQEIRTQRENELAHLKRNLEEETSGHENALSSMRHKHNKTMDDLNEQLETLKKVLHALMLCTSTYTRSTNNNRLLFCVTMVK